MHYFCQQKRTKRARTRWIYPVACRGIVLYGRHCILCDEKNPIHAFDLASVCPRRFHLPLFFRYAVCTINHTDNQRPRSDFLKSLRGFFITLPKTVRSIRPKDTHLRRESEYPVLVLLFRPRLQAHESKRLRI